MSLLVHYQNLKHFDADKCQWLGEKGQNAIDQKKQADTLGWLMMSIGVYEISTKTIDEMIFRVKLLDFIDLIEKKIALKAKNPTLQYVI